MSVRIILLLVLPGLLASCVHQHVAPTTPATQRLATASDPIATLVARLSATHGLWLNGIYPVIDLPAAASTEQVLTKVFEMTGFGSGHVTTYRIIETRQVRIDSGFPESPYTAVLVETDMGRKIVLLQPPKTSSPPSGWWSRVYDA